MTPDLFLDEPWDDSPTSFLDEKPSQPCGLAWLPLLGLYMLIGGAASGVVHLATHLQRRKP